MVHSGHIVRPSGSRSGISGSGSRCFLVKVQLQPVKGLLRGSCLEVMFRSHMQRRTLYMKAVEMVNSPGVHQQFPGRIASLQY